MEKMFNDEMSIQNRIGILRILSSKQRFLIDVCMNLCIRLLLQFLKIVKHFSFLYIASIFDIISNV